MVLGLNYVMLHLPNVAEVKDFYTELLGLKIEEQNPGFIQFERPGGNGATLAVSNFENADALARLELWWFVDDAQATYDKFVKQGVEIIAPLEDKPFGRAFGVKDPSGQPFYLLELPKAA